MKFFKTIFLLIILITSCSSYAQRTKLDSLVSDTIKLQELKEHSPTKATLLSTFIPGAGQVYNKKYWKVPIVYVTIGTMLYFAFDNQKNFSDYKDAYALRVDGYESTVDKYEGILSDDVLKSNMDYHQRNRDLSYIFAGLFYVFNIVDAAVDAHLFNFPKNDNLSFNLQPTIGVTADNQINHGFRLVVNL